MTLFQKRAKKERRHVEPQAAFPSLKTLIYTAVGLYDTHSLYGFSPKVPKYKNS